MNLKHAQVKVIELQKATASVMNDLANTEDKNIDDLINENKQNEQEEANTEKDDEDEDEDEKNSQNSSS